MATFSIYDGTTKETIGYFLGGSYSIGSTYVDNILNSLKDNNSKLVFEKDVRNAVFSLASSFIFKETTASQSIKSYIGVDNLNIGATTSPISLRDVKGYKYLFGKRSYSGTYSYQNSHDIFHLSSTYSLLTSDVDMFFYNTKGDDVSNNLTRLRILSGTSTDNFNISPYIQSQIVETGLIDSLSLDFVSESGDVIVRSDNGTVSFFGFGLTTSINFPSYSNSFASASNNKVLKWQEGNLYWDEIRYPSNDVIGSTGSHLNIYGYEVYINNFPLQFTDDRKIPITFNDIKSGENFNQYQLSDLIRRLVYPYLKPELNLSILPPYNSGLVEVGSYPTPTIYFEIKKKSLNTGQVVLENMIPGFYPPINSNTYITATGTSNGIVISPVSNDSTIFKMSVSDGQNLVSASTSISGIYPYFYGFSDLSVMTNIGLNGLNKLIEDKSDKTIDIVGNGNFFYIYDYNYGTLSNIYDNFGNTCSIGTGASFSFSERVFSSPSGLWAGKKFYVYQWNSATMSPPSKNFEFKY